MDEQAPAPQGSLASQMADLAEANTPADAQTFIDKIVIDIRAAASKGIRGIRLSIPRTIHDPVISYLQKRGFELRIPFWDSEPWKDGFSRYNVTW